MKTRSVGQIVHDNVCTLFNLVNAVLALIVLFAGSYKNMLFMVVIVCNTVIGIVQEVRSKRITDKLSIIAGSKAHVLRDGAETELPLDGLVRDDVVVLRRGDQVPADAQVVSGDCRVNESLLTGEANLVRKQLGDTLMSGLFGNGVCACGPRGCRELCGEDLRRGKGAQGRAVRDHALSERHYQVRQLHHVSVGRAAFREGLSLGQLGAE